MEGIQGVAANLRDLNLQSDGLAPKRAKVDGYRPPLRSFEPNVGNQVFSCPPPAPGKGEKVQWNPDAQCWYVCEVSEGARNPVGTKICGIVDGKIVQFGRDGEVRQDDDEEMVAAATNVQQLAFELFGLRPL